MYNGVKIESLAISIRFLPGTLALARNHAHAFELILSYTRILHCNSFVAPRQWNSKRVVSVRTTNTGAISRQGCSRI